MDVQLLNRTGLALIVGIGNYNYKDQDLPYAVNDANCIADKLLNLGFVVNKITDCTAADLMKASKEFGTQLQRYDVGLFYFAGHGLQIEGLNYLTCTDTSFIDDPSTKFTSVCLDHVIGYMQEGTCNINILILDACRDNPYIRKYRGAEDSGLAPIHAPKGTIIAFSTSPGEKAQDYGNGPNSIYTESFLKHIDTANLPIEAFFKRVRTSVYDLSKKNQTSWEHTSLIGDFCFTSGQMIHAVDLHYEDDHIADTKFISSGTEIDEIISGLRSHNWYEQGPAMVRLRSVELSKLDKSTLFLLGRNILQAADGDERNAKRTIGNLATWLMNTYPEKDNHILNGILYEIYFDSEGQFRQSNFKVDLVEYVFALQSNKHFIKSFEFIQDQLRHFPNFIFFIPGIRPDSIAVEVQWELVDQSIGELKLSSHKLVSVKHEGSQIMAPYDDNEFSAVAVKYTQFVHEVRKQLAVPAENLVLSMNAIEKNIKTVTMPWEFRLSKQPLATKNIPVPNLN